MSTQYLGTIDFLETPTVSGTQVLLNSGNTPEILSDLFTNRPLAGMMGRLFVSIDTNAIYRDDGSNWTLLSDGSSIRTLQIIPVQIAEISGTTTRTDSNTTPPISAGTEVLSQNITPTYINSKIFILGSVHVDHSSNARKVILGIFRDNTCIGVANNYINSSGRGGSLSITFVDIPNTTSTITYSIRAWSNGSGTWHVARASTNLYNGLLSNQTIIFEERL